MDALTINPFIESVRETFERMMGVAVEMGTPRPMPSLSNSVDIIGVIGLTGTAQGVVALRFPVVTALAIVSRLIGIDTRAVDRDTIDAVGELVNIVAGGAKSRFKGHTISVSLPTVVRGDLCRLSKATDAIWVEIPFTSPVGAFWMIVTIRPSTHTPREREHESACSR